MKSLVPQLLLSVLPLSTMGEEMKLVHSVTGFVVVELKDNQVKFNDRFLKAELEEQGILIPPAMRSQFNGKETVYLDDPLFPKAFIEVYYPLCIADPTYTWVQDSDG